MLLFNILNFIKLIFQPEDYNHFIYNESLAGRN
jgi:hypothetical protein